MTERIEGGQKFVVTLPSDVHQGLREEAFRRTVAEGRLVHMTELVREAVETLLQDQRRAFPE